MDNRNHMGKNKEGVIFPVAPNLSEMKLCVFDMCDICLLGNMAFPLFFY